MVDKLKFNLYSEEEIDVFKLLSSLYLPLWY